jgi:energy-coupling factor transport system ATP-binding protein
MSSIEIENFSYTYPGETQPALQDINLSINSGAFVVITGKSGSGKSTLGKALAGFLFQDEIPDYKGKILVNGADMTQLPIQDACEHVAYVQQNPEDQFCTLTVMDEIAFGLENFCMDPEMIERRIDLVLEIVQGKDLKKRYLASLSGGEKQKIAIASLLAIEPDVLILDEPTSNLDPNATKHVFETLYQIRKNRDITLIIIEHKLSQLMPLDPELFELEQGKIVSRESIEGTQSNILQPIAHHSIVLEPKIQMSEAFVEISHVNVDLGGNRILNQIDLKINPGEFIALMGPNGSGKSTLLETIIGFHPLQSGSCTVFDKSQVNKNTSSLVRDIGYIFQNPDHQLFTQSVWDEATFTSSNLADLDDERKARAKKWLEEMGLGKRLEDHPQRLSYGEKRRLNLISAMLHSPKLLLIDELLIGQDLGNAHQWMTILKDYTNNGGAVLLVNHHPDLTQSYCDRIVFLDHGYIILDLPTSSAFQELTVLGYDTFLPSEIMENPNA